MSRPTTPCSGWASSPMCLWKTAAYGTSFGTMDIGTVVPIAAGFSMQAEIKNLFDRDYYYTVGYPEAGRNWYFNGRYIF
jgi:outer membrane cobalamin receptor